MAEQHESDSAMTKEAVAMLQEDRIAAIQLLNRHGFLLDLPSPTLKRCIGDHDSVKIFSDQIRQREATVTECYVKTAMTAVENIERLGSLPGDALPAMRLLVTTAEDYLYANCKYLSMKDPDDKEYKTHAEIAAMDELMDQLVRTQYAATQGASQDWDPSEIREVIEDVSEPRRPDGCSFFVYEEEELQGLFQNSLRLLHIIVCRRAGEVIAMKVAGHRLPTELVDMIQNLVCSDEELKEFEDIS